jgi:hypothetical protein
MNPNAHDPMTCTLGGCFNCDVEIRDPRVIRSNTVAAGVAIHRVAEAAQDGPVKSS